MKLRPIIDPWLLGIQRDIRSISGVVSSLSFLSLVFALNAAAVLAMSSPRQGYIPNRKVARLVASDGRGEVYWYASLS